MTLPGGTALRVSAERASWDDTVPRYQSPVRTSSEARRTWMWISGATAAASTRAVLPPEGRCRTVSVQLPIGVGKTAAVAALVAQYLDEDRRLARLERLLDAHLRNVAGRLRAAFRANSGQLAAGQASGAVGWLEHRALRARLHSEVRHLLVEIEWLQAGRRTVRRGRRRNRRTVRVLVARLLVLSVPRPPVPEDPCGVVRRATPRLPRAPQPAAVSPVFIILGTPRPPIRHKILLPAAA